MAKKIVIIGAGAGGGISLSKLRRVLKDEDVDITIIDKLGRTDFQPSYIFLSIGQKRVKDLSRDFNLLNGGHVKTVKDEVVSVDAQNRIVNTLKGKYSYDYLIMSPGPDIKKDSFEGIEATDSVWTLEDSLKLRAKIKEFNGGKILISVSSQWYKCPPVPWEMALLLDDYFRKKNMRDKVEITVAHPVSKPMEMYGPGLSDPFAKMLEKRSIGGLYGKKLLGIDASKKEAVFEDDDRLRFDLSIVAPPHSPPSFIKDNEYLRSKNGWASTNLKDFRNPKYDDIFAIGDVIAPTIQIGMAGVLAHFQADTASSAIAEDIIGYPFIDYNKNAVCIIATGSSGVFSYCDLSAKLTDPSVKFPECRMIGNDPLFRFAHDLYEVNFLSSIYGNR
ncbi:flavoprotein reductase [Thermoplasma volcanium GSS1]|uniref:Flavoprotein reductase n=1 Tax=Thermoplasma volcanium (strain ATCC 51530 / DSM 4299 / JCM 9571 / NBRC 15438 / GSS1) TaxID=273116 RepID=Q97BI4_THEVO|nr:FAD/NAD(P)-binding oxidoreductase [Thermoplasma volcanium]BAB59613.1 flavoprotein reductase [Thermoplasma volcanium GSS1]